MVFAIPVVAYQKKRTPRHLDTEAHQKSSVTTGARFILRKQYGLTIGQSRKAIPRNILRSRNIQMCINVSNAKSLKSSKYFMRRTRNISIMNRVSAKRQGGRM